MNRFRFRTVKRLIARRAWFLTIALVCGLGWLSDARIYAHGEAADEPFLKVLTTAFHDISISPTEVKIGEPVTITGTVRVLRTWPYTMPAPERAYLTAVVPGPVFAMKERTINGESAPHSIFVKRDGIYQFKMVLIARRPGHWHVHPGLAVEGTGTLIGPGEYVNVTGDAAAFTFPVKLVSGETVNLDTFGGQFIWWFPFIGFLVGVVWMLYWTWWQHRTVTNLAVTIQIPLNDEGADIGLITAKDHFWMNVLAGVTVVILIIGWVYNVSPSVIRLPQQTVWLDPPSLAPEPSLAEATPLRSTYDDGSGTLLLNLDVKNVSSSPIALKQYTLGLVSFVNGDEQAMVKAGPREFVDRLEVEPNTPIAPGETRAVRLRMTSKLFATERIVPTHAPQQFIAGLVRVEKADGGQQMVLMRSNIVPTEFGNLVSTP
jgi:methane/ammonia monooxygenase subunit B